MRTKKKPKSRVDPKDKDTYPPPPTHHIIKCKECSKEAKVAIRYTRLCVRCREEEIRSNTDWAAWNGTSHIDSIDRQLPSWNTRGK
jgi:hypothetical protein